MTTTESSTALIVGASRTIGLALAKEFLNRGWHVIGTVRGTARTPLHDLADASEGAVAVETLDTTDGEQLKELRQRLDGQQLDLIFVNAAITNGDEPVQHVATSTFIDVMVTNALSPLRVVEALQDLVPESGTIGIMSSRQGSVSLNTNGQHDVYRASKSALNQLMRSFAARHPDDPRTFLLINPGWVKTELGGAWAHLSIDESVPGVADVIVAHRGEGGLHFLDYQDQVVPW